VGKVNLYTVSLGRKRGSLARYTFEYLAFFVWTFLKLSALMRKRAYEVIDVNNLPDFLVFAALWARWKGAKVVFDMHEITPEFYMSKYKISKDSWIVRFLKLIEKRSMRFADRVITINEPIQQLLESRGLESSKSTIITNSVDEDFFFAGASSPGVAGPEVKRADFVMMYHGTLTHIYGLDIAIEAFGQVHEKMPGGELWILGDGPERLSLEELVGKLGLQDKVKLLGTVRPQRIPEWLKQCDIGVLATRQDVFLDLSFSSKLSEYIIMDKAVISSRLKTIRHYFSEQALAFFAPGQSHDLARQMLYLYEHPEQRAALAARARQEYAPIRWGLMKQRYLNMMEEITKAPAAARQDAANQSRPPGTQVVVQRGTDQAR
jgi:glycosyltransferase involved in cell wall biosynthesis